MKKFNEILINSGIEVNEAKKEVEIIIEEISSLTSKDFVIGKTLTKEQYAKVLELVNKRAETKLPIQYILNSAYFMGEKFFVDENVLIPRDETEILTSKAIEIIKANNFTSALDMCTGSGCIACITAKNTDCHVIGVDISTDALHTAFKNMEKLELYNRATFRKSNLFGKIREDETFDIIISNPPYIPPKERANIQSEVSFEPEIALYTQDENGLEFYEKITRQAPNYLNKGGYLMFELGINQSQEVKRFMLDSGFCDIEIIKDLAGIDRVIIGKLK